jgi:hypothetical protein
MCQKFVAGTIGLSKAGKRGKRMPLAIACVARAARGGYKQWTYPGGSSKHLLVECYIAPKKNSFFGSRQALYGAIQNIGIGRGRWLCFGAGVNGHPHHGNCTNKNKGTLHYLKYAMQKYKIRQD